MKTHIIKNSTIIGLMLVATILSICPDSFALVGDNNQNNNTRVIEIYAFHNRDTDKAPSPYLMTNYAEYHFITIVALERVGQELKMFYGSPIPKPDACTVKISGGTPGNLKYALINASQCGVFLPNFNKAFYISGGGTCAPIFKDFFYALGDNASTLIYLDSQVSSLIDRKLNYFERHEIKIDFWNNPVIIAVASWNYEKNPPDLNITISPADVPTGFQIIVKQQPPPLKLEIDMLDFYRENIKDNVKKMIPRAGENYTGDPGPFVIKGVTHPAAGSSMLPNEVYKVLATAAVNRAEGRINENQPVSGDGPDWLQLAAVHICNEQMAIGANPDVFNCVWRIKTAGELIVRMKFGKLFDHSASVPCPESGGAVFVDSEGLFSEDFPSTIMIGPYSELVRFNSDGTTYDFYCKHVRDAMIFHETLHCYQALPGKDVHDEEDPTKRYGDSLFVKLDQLGRKTANPYLIFGYDSKSRGYLGFDISIKDQLYGWLYSERAGDSVWHTPQRAVFIIEIELTPEEWKAIFENKVILSDNSERWKKKLKLKDLPGRPDSPMSTLDIFIRDEKRDTTKSFSREWIKLDNMLTIVFGDPSANPNYIPGKDGYYIHNDYQVRIKGINSNSSNPNKDDSNVIRDNELKARIEDGAKVYLVYEIKLPYKPLEYDASYFSAISQGPHVAGGD